MADEERKIIVDEDWKAQVEREREQAKKAKEEAAQVPPDSEEAAGQPGAEQPAVAAPQAEAPAERPDTPVAPEAAPETEGPEGEGREGTPFMQLVSDLATQTMLALGIIAPQGSEKVYVDLAQAKYLVDMLIVLRDKTKGNLTPQEKGHITEAVSELQRMFALRAQQVEEQTLKDAGIDPTNLKKPPQQ